MSKLDELIKELCPDGVEYKKLKECTEMKRGTSATKRTLSEGNIPVVSGGKEPAFYCDTSNRIGETITVAGSGAGAGYVQYWNKPIFVNDAFSIKGNEGLKTRYIYHYLLNIQEGIYATKKGGGVPHVYISSIENFVIPLPTLPIQLEIIRILDNFTELIAELTAELTARKKQYEYYRDELLSFGDEVPMVRLGDIATDIYRGGGIKRDEVTDVGVPCVRYGEIYTSYNLTFTECKSHTKGDVVKNPKWFEHGDIIFTITGESIEEIAKSIAYLGYEKCMAGGDTVVLKHNQEPRYMSYALSTNHAQAQKSKGKVKSKVVHSSVSSLKEIAIPLPNYKTQIRIADLLDGFHILIDDISKGLPAEIKARQQQYEYYRDKLLTFKEKEA